MAFSILVAPVNLTELSEEQLERVAGGTDFIATAVTEAASAATASVAVSVATKAS